MAELNELNVWVYISGVTQCVKKFLTLSQSVGFDSVKNFVTHFVTPKIWILSLSPVKIDNTLNRNKMKSDLISVIEMQIMHQN